MSETQLKTQLSRRGYWELRESFGETERVRFRFDLLDGDGSIAFRGDKSCSLTRLNVLSLFEWLRAKVGGTGGWISVEDRLPEDGVACLVTDCNDGWIAISVTGDATDCTHWSPLLPLPAPPQEQE